MRKIFANVRMEQVNAILKTGMQYGVIIVKHKRQVRELTNIIYCVLYYQNKCYSNFCNFH